MQAAGFEVAALAEDLVVGLEADLGAAPVHDRAELFELGLRHAAREHHAVELLAARDFDFADFRQRVDDGDADAVQAARGFVGLAVEFAAGVQRGHDDFERALVLEFRMRVDRDAATVVNDGQIAVGFEPHFDAGGVAGDGFVHGVVDHLGEEVVHGLFVGAADVHAGAAADGLQAFQDLDVGGGVVLFSGLTRPRLPSNSVSSFANRSRDPAIGYPAPFQEWDRPQPRTRAINPSKSALRSLPLDVARRRVGLASRSAATVLREREAGKCVELAPT